MVPYIVFQYGLEPVLFQRIFIGLQAIGENLLKDQIINFTCLGARVVISWFFCLTSLARVARGSSSSGMPSDKDTLTKLHLSFCKKKTYAWHYDENYV